MFYDHNGDNNNQSQQPAPRFFFDQNGNRFDHGGNMVSEQGDIIVPSQAIDLFRSSQHTQQYAYFPGECAQELVKCLKDGASAK